VNLQYTFEVAQLYGLLLYSSFPSDSAYRTFHSFIISDTLIRKPLFLTFKTYFNLGTKYMESHHCLNIVIAFLKSDLFHPDLFHLQLSWSFSWTFTPTSQHIHFHLFLRKQKGWKMKQTHPLPFFCLCYVAAGVMTPSLRL